MNLRKTPYPLIEVSFTFILTLLSVESAVAQLPFIHGQRSFTRCSLPKYNYGHDTPRFSANALAVADAVRPVAWPVDLLSDGEMQSVSLIRPTSPVQATSISLIAPDPDSRNGQERLVQRKPFHFTQSSLTVDHISLEQVGLSIYESGHISASGRITHDGGADGGLQGNNVTIRLLAYSAAVDQPGRLPLNSHQVWAREHQLWIKRGPSQVVALTGITGHWYPDIRRHFNGITHFVIELSYQRDR